MQVIDLGLRPYQQAWDIQEQAHARVLGGDEESLLIVRHPPVITLGRRGDVGGHVLRSREQLRALGIDFLQSDRGGDVTFHGPGQIVAYPIIRLAAHRLTVGAYVHQLESIALQTIAHFGIEGWTDPKAVGVWVGPREKGEKICAIGVRIRRGVSLHGLALNVEQDLSGFEYINPCGFGDRSVTSIAKLLGNKSPSLEQVRIVLVRQFSQSFALVE